MAKATNVKGDVAECTPPREGVHPRSGFIQKDHSRAAQESDGYAQLAALPP